MFNRKYFASGHLISIYAVPLLIPLATSQYINDKIIKYCMKILQHAHFKLACLDIVTVLYGGKKLMSMIDNITFFTLKQYLTVRLCSDERNYLLVFELALLIC
ncbi:hypothetical protein GDO81_002413 [Engystomops pustulosus]|uniref:Secreted protein n=1 Tax=Engystomops pustulosus TaxID=76066 RepID=A0AAV7DL17_ENGPU|nr:hypothetical protein GDO81_002413 [Engystomops pustulosus]